MFNSIYYFRFIIMMMMITTYFPLVAFRLPPIVGSHHLYAAIFVGTLLLERNKVFANKFVLLLLAYGLFAFVMQSLIWTYMSDWSESALWIDNYYPILLGTLILNYFYESKDYKGLALICKWSLIFMFITSIGTIVASFMMGTTERLAIFGDSEEAQQTQALFGKYGSGSYGTSIVFMSVIAIVVYYLKQINLFFINKRWLLYVFVALLFGAVLRLQIFTNVLFAAAVLLFSIVSAESRIKLPLWIFAMSLVLYFVPSSVYVDVFKSLSFFFKDKLAEISYKFEELAYYMEFGTELVSEDNALAVRAARGPILFEAFLKYPILGFHTSLETKTIETYHVYHLYWLSTLAKFGILNLFFYAYLFYKFIMLQKRRVNSNYFYYFFIAVMSVILYGLPKVTGGREAWYFVFIIAPGCYYLPLISKQYMRKLFKFKRESQIRKTVVENEKAN